MAKKSARNERRPSAPLRKAPQQQQRARATALKDDSGNNAKIPPTGLVLSNHSDGSFTVSSAHHAVTIAASSAPTPKPGRRGGFVVVGVVPGESLPEGTTPVRDADELKELLKMQVSNADLARAIGGARPQEVHFSLKGLHTLDLHELSAITGGAESSVTAHIHMAATDNPKIPPGG